MNDLGRAAQAIWVDLPAHYPHVHLDAQVIMPNHVHGIVLLVGAGSKPAPTTATAKTRHGLPEIIRGFKTFSARRINAMRATPGKPVWQRNYYEHIIRDEASLNRIRQYIADNPSRWAEEQPRDVRVNRGRDRPWML